MVNHNNSINLGSVSWSMNLYICKCIALNLLFYPLCQSHSLVHSPDLFHVLCSQSVVVPAPHGRWVEELSRETKRPEEERQVCWERRERVNEMKGYCLRCGGGGCGCTKKPPFIREESRDETQTFDRGWRLQACQQRDGTRCWCGSFTACLKSGDGSVVFVVLLLFSSSSRLRDTWLRSGPVEWMWGKMGHNFEAF